MWSNFFGVICLVFLCIVVEYFLRMGIGLFIDYFFVFREFIDRNVKEYYYIKLENVLNMCK